MNNQTILILLNEVHDMLPSLQGKVLDKYILDIEKFIIIAKNSINESKPFTNEDKNYLKHIGLMTVKEIEDADSNLAELIYQVTSFFRTKENIPYKYEK